MPKKRKNITAKRVQASEKKPRVPNVVVTPETDDDEIGNDGLTIKQRLLVSAITGSARGNATKAAEMAGYRSENRVALASTAYEQLRKPQIKEAIRLALAKKCGDAEWTRLSIIDLARSSMENYIYVDANGIEQIDWATAAAAGAIGQIKEYEVKQVKDADGNTVFLPKIKLHDRVQALGMLAKMHGLINDRPPPTVDEMLETYEALDAAEVPPDAVPTIPRPGPVQGSAGGPTIGQDGTGETKADS